MTNIEKEWMTSSGLLAVSIFANESHRCGYVGVPKSNSLHGVPYSGYGMCQCTPEYIFNVHGGITFSGPLQGDEWWFGFDCAHHGDATMYTTHGIFRDLDFVINECESLATQIMEFT